MSYIGFDSCLKSCRENRTQISNLRRIRKWFLDQFYKFAQGPLERWMEPIQAEKVLSLEEFVPRITT